MGGGARGEPDAEPKAEDGVQDRPDGVRQRAPVDDRDRRRDRPAAAEEAGAVRFVLDGARGLALDSGDVRRPDRRLAGGAWPAGREQGADLGHALGLDEQVLEGRVRDVGRLGRQHDLGV